MPSLSSDADRIPAAPAGTAVCGLAVRYLRLAKARLSALVLMTTAVGFVLASSISGSAADWLAFLGTIIGTALAAGAANALNQVLEIRRDAIMRRTRRRPLPARELSARHAWIVAFSMAGAGLTMLLVLANGLAALLAALTIVIYAGLYTPLKVRSALNTLVGAVCGAIPPLIGWAGARGSLEAGAFLLAALLFVWQIPHFLSLAWVYRREYARARFAMLPTLDRDGSLTGRIILLTSLMLVPLTLTATLLGLAGWLYSLGALGLGLWLLSRAVGLYARPSDAGARRVFLASIVYLSAILALLVLDRGPAVSLMRPQYAAGPLADLPAAAIPVE
jgi:protoheme IX farnesyltransferase